MGVVLKAFDEQLHRVVAIKVMAQQLATSATARKRFVREARAQAAVTHDHVVTIHAVAESGPLPYIVMQFVAGTSLQDRLDRTGPLPLTEILRIGTQAASGLAAAHAQGLVHRDVKPANILLENGVERVKLTDFGLARAADDASLTQSGQVAGTPQYMSPEQAEGQPIDARSDLFSLGSVLYAMCTGRPPFRAGTSMGVLKRVCEDDPTPIRQANPEVPDWLAAAVEKLHAKDPAARFQSAAEVAELLGRHLAHVQHPSVVQLPVAVRPAGDPPEPVRRSRGGRRWAVAPAALLLLVAGLGTTEATGVTNVRATVIRILTPEGTLVVETDDPAVKVVVEGDGDLVITGAGPQEVRLRAGSYRLQATKDGKPVKLDRDLVAISRGDRQIVRVRLEGDAPAAAVPTTEREAFVLLAAGKERKFDTLAEAVLAAGFDGDTIEVRGNGPFATESLTIRKSLTIRAGHGFRPVIRLTPEVLHNHDSLLAEAPLVLEGLELQRVIRSRKDGEPPQTLVAATRGLYAANCRFLSGRVEFLIFTGASPCELRNCEVLGSDGAVPIAMGWLQPGQQLVLENCLVAGLQTWSVDYTRTGEEECRVRLTRNTFRAVEGNFHLHLSLEAAPDLKQLDEGVKGLRVQASGNVFDARAVLATGRTLPAQKFPPAEVLRFLGRHFEWKGERNVYATDGSLARGPWPEKSWEPVAEMKGLAEWRQFWGSAETGSAAGTVRYQGGDPLARLADPEKLGPDDFRLRPDSVGYRAGKDGTDLGADVDLVGPGLAYERWKKTPDYQQWLKDTEHLRAKAPKPEPGAFMLLGGPRVAERKFDTLAEAARFANDGDIIEVRGNGPFVSEPIDLGRTALTIRAGTGFRPVILHSAPPQGQPTTLLRTSGALAIEGIEFRRRGPGHLIACGQSPLYLANCRLIGRLSLESIVSESPICTVRNCEFVDGADNHIAWIAPAGGRLLLDNNVIGRGHMGLSLATESGDLYIRLTRSTFMANFPISLSAHSKPGQPTARAEPARKPIQIEAAGNVFDGAICAVNVFQPKRIFPPEESGTWLTNRANWQERRNVYRSGIPILSAGVEEGNWQPVPGFRTLSDWHRAWTIADSGSREGRVHYQGGTVVAKAQVTPELVKTDEFRLRPNSAGYRAGQGGKDLGADVDLVGPGAAYEKWKKTPEYQQWLKESGQVKK